MSQVDNSTYIKLDFNSKIERLGKDLKLRNEDTFQSGSFDIEKIIDSLINTEKSSSELNTFPFNSGFAGVNDLWEEVTIIDGRIIDIFENEVEVECLIDVENKIFEKRTFYSLLFKNLDVDLGDYVRIRIMVKSEKMTITIREGEKLVNKEVFEEGTFVINDELEILDNIKFS